MLIGGICVIQNVEICSKYWLSQSAWDDLKGKDISKTTNEESLSVI